MERRSTAFPPRRGALREWPRGLQGRGGRISRWIQLGEMLISMKWRLFTPITHRLCVYFRFFSLFWLMVLDVILWKGTFFRISASFFGWRVFFGSSMSGLGPGFSWRTWNESFKYVWGKFGSVGSPQSFESLSRGMDTQWTPKIASQFFSRFYKLWVRNHLFALKVFGSSSSW